MHHRILIPMLFFCAAAMAASDRFVTATENDQQIIRDLEAPSMMWTLPMDGGMVWQDAQAYCDSLDYAGFQDWRLPSGAELQTLLAPKRIGSAYSHFPGLRDSWYWTADIKQADVLAYAVGFGGGGLSFGGVDRPCAVLCIRP